jgi:bifunctional DNA-binding transcriptional regulator/antitoxin component of YhaV-PrlF toxin-antitoxin module
MKATIDRDGRIILGRELQSKLGVQPGDEVLFENQGGEWVIKPVKSMTGLCFEGNVLVHRGVTPEPCSDPLAAGRDERFDQLTEGLPR